MVGNKKITNAYDESVNFNGAYQNQFNFGRMAMQRNIIFSKGCMQVGFNFANSGYVNEALYFPGASQYQVVLGENALQFGLNLSPSSNIFYLIMGKSSQLSYVSIANNATVVALTLEESSSNAHLNLENSSLLTGRMYPYSGLQYSELGKNCYLDFGTNPLAITVQFVKFLAANNTNIVMPDISTATYIIDTDLMREVYARPDGTVKIRFMNDSDVLVVANVED